MTTAFKQRMVGAIFILSLGVILIPLILDSPQIDHLDHAAMTRDIPKAPALPDVAEVASIHYVFDEETPVKDAPLPVADASDAIAMLPAAPEEKMGPPLPPQVDAVPASQPALLSSLPTPSAGHLKASAHLAETSQAQWTIQLGAFSSEKNANALLTKLTQGGYTPYLRAMTQDSLVRVYVSPGVSREQAVDLATKLDTEYGLKGIVVRYYQ